MTQYIVSAVRRFTLVDIFTASSYGFQYGIMICGTAINIGIRILQQKIKGISRSVLLLAKRKFEE